MAIDQMSSWFNPSGTPEFPNLIGQIFFATDDQHLDGEDRLVIEQLANAIKKSLGREGAYLRPFGLLYKGWADYRGAAGYNLALSKRRADSVKQAFDEFFVGKLGTPFWRQVYNAESMGAGEGKARGSGIAGDRRVDILSTRKMKWRIDFDEVDVKGELKDKDLSRRFKIRMVGGFSGGLGPIPLTVYLLKVDLWNPRNGKRRRLRFDSVGGGFGLPVGFSRTGDWQDLDAGSFMDVDDFEGRANITSASGGVESSTIVTFYGPADYGRTEKLHKVIDRPVVAKFSGWDLNLGVGGADGFMLMMDDIPPP
jgi:outer membrane protein OmpA-like peptidoglycan-associated protein